MADMDALCEQARQSEGLGEDDVPAIALVLEQLRDVQDNLLPDKDIVALIDLVEYWEVAHAAKLGRCKAQLREAVARIEEQDATILEMYGDNRVLAAKRRDELCG